MSIDKMLQILSASRSRPGYRKKKQSNTRNKAVTYQGRIYRRF